MGAATKIEREADDADAGGNKMQTGRIKTRSNSETVGCHSRYFNTMGDGEHVENIATKVIPMSTAHFVS